MGFDFWSYGFAENERTIDRFLAQHYAEGFPAVAWSRVSCSIRRASKATRSDSYTLNPFGPRLYSEIVPANECLTPSAHAATSVARPRARQNASIAGRADRGGERRQR